MTLPPTLRPGLPVALAVRQLPPPSSVLQLAEPLWRRAHPWLLESSLPGPPRGRYSFAGADPYLVLRCFGRRAELEVRRGVRPDLEPGRWRFEADPLDAVRACLPGRPACVPDGAPPFCGGAVGVFGYELGGSLERLPPPPVEGLALPDVALLFVDRVLAFDHLDRRLFACGLGFGASAQEAEVRARATAEALACETRAGMAAAAPACQPQPTELPTQAELEELAASLPVHRDFDEASYAKTVTRILEEIGAGNVYQACLTQRLTARFDGDALALHRRLRRLNPAPFAACLELPGVSVVSSSPERFLRVSDDGSVESRPIKGTRPRGSIPDEDRALRRALSASEKDRAENLMIVDLMRNDLGRVCSVGSVHVPELMAIEPYATVFQMVSTIRGRLRPGCDALDAVRACFPPGSMTGAPKIAAMSLLAHLERCRRGVYSGALGYLDARGGADLSVVIRAVLLEGGRAHVHVGGGIVADSVPEAEYRESMDKARAQLAALAWEPRSEVERSRGPV
ncbi:MAG: aminodeoxychorismate synthase component I [Myxococcota bacterium]